MPISNGAYTSPTWKNGSPPAISPSEMNDFASAVQSSQYQVGDIRFSRRSLAQMGDDWLTCNGASFSSSSYPLLASLIPSLTLPSISKTYGTAYIRAKNPGSYSPPDFSTAKLSAANLQALSDTAEANRMEETYDILITKRSSVSGFQYLASDQGARVCRKNTTGTPYLAPTWQNNAPPAIGVTQLQPLTECAEYAQKRVGDILFSKRPTIPGWLLCNGQSVDQQRYPALYSIVGGTTPVITQSGVQVFIRATTTQPATSTFTLSGNSFLFETGMTWAQFVSSPYNSGAFVVDGTAIKYNGAKVQTSGGVNVSYASAITPGGSYRVEVLDVRTFTIRDAQSAESTFSFENGMTWAQFISSGYSSDRFTVSGSKAMYDGQEILTSGGAVVYTNAAVTPNGTYHVETEEKSFLFRDFSGNDTTYYFDAGMTWAQFIVSAYNDGGFFQSDVGDGRVMCYYGSNPLSLYSDMATEIYEEESVIDNEIYSIGF